MSDSSANTGDPKDQKQRVWRELHDFHTARTQSSSSLSGVADNTDSSTAAVPTASTKQCQRSWPSYDKVAAHIAKADYNHTLTCPMDFVRPSADGSHQGGKTICPHAAVCCVRMELFPCPDGQTPYTGLLSPNAVLEHGILRLSSAVKPPAELQSAWARAVLMASGEKLRNSRLFPCAALKFFRRNVASGNLLFGGSKIGQRETDYFAHCQCTTMTERMPRLVKPFVKKFWKYSHYPLSLGLSDFCQYTVEGDPVVDDTCNFPFALVIKPSADLQTFTDQQDMFSGDADSAFDHFLDTVLSLPANTVLFDVFACANPQDATEPSKLQRIGRITSTSPMIPSSPDDGIFFKHQKKEEDYELRPDWEEALQTKVAIDQGRTTGTVGQLVGWKLFEQHIAQNAYIDFERK